MTTILIELLIFLLGLFLPKIIRYTDKIINSQKYAVAKQVYKVIDPIIEKVLGDVGIDYKSISDSVEAAYENGDISETEKQAIANFIINKFDLGKVIS